MTDDEQLLRQYAQEHSESAFGELAARHIDLVYSAALRIGGGDTHLAEDVTQMVFIDLARKARILPRDVMLAGWLYRHTSYTAANAVRTERRRKGREQTAMEMRALDDNAEPPWERIAPHLDESLNQLRAGDRDAIVLRFLKRQELRAVGAALGISEDAAQKRVSRALEKLRGVLQRRGIALPAAALASGLAANAVTAAPTGLADSVAAAAAGSAETTFTLLELMAATKLKTGLIGAIVVASVVTPLMLHQRAQATLRDQGEALRQQTDRLARWRSDNERLSNRLALVERSRRVPDDAFREVLRLRDAVTRLGLDVQESMRRNRSAPTSRIDRLESMAAKYSQRVTELKRLLEANPSEKIPELRFLTADDWLWLANKTTLDTEDGYRRAMSITRKVAEENFARDELKPTLQKFSNDHGGQFPGDVAQLRPYFKSPVDDALLARWTVLPKSRLVKQLGAQLNEDWYVTQKAPVNAALDQRILYGLKDSHSFADGPPTFWDVTPQP